MIVTTADRPNPEAVRRAERLAAELKAAVAPRAGRTLRQLRAATGEREILVVGEKDLKLDAEGEPPFFFHPSMALVRLKGLLKGGQDALLSATGAAPGDTVLDCTAGLCADAIVLSYAAGERGRVVALEASRTIHLIVREGLRTYETGLPEADAAMRAVEAAHGRYEERLPRMPDKSVDIVYFDPMFEKPVRSSSALAPLRARALGEPLTEEAVREATRVARKKVVLKDHRESGRFERLGFRPARKSSSAVAYGVIDID
ncbi:class I SAM-dependent methyltransferase [Paenibacillaceae bacterium WGS1546]|uniref:class I SAM-dependent methyltransferase n=1 Tax=Cohnella sp. WGS1546 TaxID=3366810 RepID=UPI00372D7603